jgi:quaternary ammonium compound-resistance protein SugE
MGSDAAEAAIPDEGESYPACKDDRVEGGHVVMPWLVLILSGLLESIWAIALSQSAGFTRVAPSVVFVIGLVGSMIGLGFALRTIPIGTGYAVWVGIGVAGTALAGMIFLGESASALRVLSLLLVFADVVGLKLFH